MARGGSVDCNLRRANLQGFFVVTDCELPPVRTQGFPWFAIILNFIPMNYSNNNYKLTAVQSHPQVAVTTATTATLLVSLGAPAILS